MDPSPQSREQAPERAATPASSPGSPVLFAPPVAASRAALWLHRISQLVLVVFCTWLGMLLVVLPWTRAWTQNRFLLHWPALRDFLGLHFVRGLASGLGLIDIWVGIWEAIHYREHP